MIQTGPDEEEKNKEDAYVNKEIDYDINNEDEVQS